MTMEEHDHEEMSKKKVHKKSTSHTAQHKEEMVHKEKDASQKTQHTKHHTQKEEDMEQSPHHQLHSEHAHKSDMQSHLAKEKENSVSTAVLMMIVVASLLIVFNQYQLWALGGMFENAYAKSSGNGAGKDLSLVSLDGIKSTGHTLAAVLPVEDIKTQDDAMTILFPTGVPEYGEDLGVSFEDPVGSLDKLAKMFPGLKSEVQKNNPEAFKRYINLASNPYGVSCEYCCGIGPIGAEKNGESRCGCQHNPALLSVTLYLAAYTEYNDAEILREVMKWKTLFFPKNMIELGMTVAGGDTSALDNLPGMVGGC